MNDSDRVPVLELVRRIFSGEQNAIEERERMDEEDRNEKAAAVIIRQAPEPWLK